VEARVRKEKILQKEREKQEESVDQEEGQGDLNIERVRRDNAEELEGDQITSLGGSFRVRMKKPRVVVHKVR
jgi:hypothetical protein